MEILDGDPDLCGSEKSFFSEKAEVIDIIHEISSKCNSFRFEELFSRLCKILINYQEQPHLLGPHLNDIMQELIKAALRLIEVVPHNFQKADELHMHEICKVIQLICRVRGYKHVIKHLPHEVHHLEPCLFILQNQDKHDHSTWETRYVMLLWLSVLCLVPFDICSIDSALSSAVSGISGDKSLLVKDVMHLCQLYLGDTGPPRDAASLCLSSLLTRPDMEEGCLRDFLGWAVGVIAHWSALDVQEQRDLSSQSFQFIGVLYCLAQIFKRGHRSKLLTYAAAVLLPCLATVGADHQTLSRKLLSKLFQRIAMTFLPPRIAEWRYTRGKRSLKQNLSGSDSSKEPIQTVDCPAESTEESAVPQEMESILQTVLNFLSDKDTVVRWSAAKGVGRITMLLPKDYADDIVGAVCGLFEDGEDDCSWHGGCLALAELARRGLLLPERLSEVVPFVERAILFDLVRGQHSVGAHVRDAACYVCWSFSRAYSPAIMQSHSAQLSASMLITALFDREVNCRRAASAAFQENVGRQGNENFPFGIEIITVADYFSVGNRGSAYLKVAPKVAAMSAEISGRLFAHLCEVKVGHWDEDVRVLAAKAVARLGPSDLPLTVQHLRVLANNCTSSLFNVRHGSILATAELLLAVAESGQSLPGDLLELVVGVVPRLEKERLYRGRGGELVRTATCLLLRNIARAAVPVTLKLQIAFVDALNEHLKQPFEALQKAASDALRQVLFAYFSRSANDPSESLRDKTVLRYVSALQSDDNVAVTRGSALALGALPLRVAVQPEGTFDLVVDCLDASSSTSKRIMGEYDAATCKNSVEALVELAERVCESDHFSASRLERVFQVLARACADYSIDKRGDTGSWTRLAALRGFERVLYAAVRRQRLFVGLERVASGELAVGDRFLSSFGVATVNSLATNANGTITAIVAFPSQSLGNLVEADFQEAVEGGALRIVMGGTILKHSPPARDAPVEAWLTPDQVARALSCLLKQLAEKLDSVREVAGNIFLRLSLSDVPLCAEDRSVFLAALKAVRRDDSCGTQVQEQFAHINWTQPDHVYAVLAEVLACPHHFHAVFSGLVISIGGITATISRAATSCLVQFLGRQQGSDNATVLQLLSSVLRLFAELHKDDRVICPLLKCVVVLLRDRILDLSAPARQSFANALVKAVLAEMRDCASVTKLSLCADVLVLLVAFDTGLARFLSLKALVRFLGHKYPKIRKYAAEQLYLQLLSDKVLVGLAYQGCGLSSCCSLFASVADADRTCQLLIETAWDVASKDIVSTAKKTIQELCCLHTTGSAVNSEELHLLGGGLHAWFNSAPPTATRSKAAQVTSDAFNSYEELVRTAG